MRTERILTLALLAALAALAATACDYEEEETSPCEYYCQTAGECHVASDQMFSATECMRSCQTSFERHSSVGCQSPYIEVIECMVDLPCQNWNDYGSACAAQIDYLDTCVEGTTY